jgi:predicted TPR repeat methyltransferase
MNRKQRRAQGKTNPPAATGGSAVLSDPIALHEAGIQAFAAGDLDRAAALIRRAIASDSMIPSFHYNLGIVLKARGQLEEAAASYQRAIALKPDHADAHNNLGNVFKTLGRHGEARASFERALQLHPGNADTHYNLGALACDLGLPDQAVPHLRRCLAADPDDKRGAGLLLAYLGAGEMPARASQAQLRSLYDARSRFWDQEPFYFGATLVADGLRRHVGSAKLDILDIGCGTGLVGVAVRDLAGRLDGVDLSPAMLEKAGSKGIYDRLFQADLASFMAGHHNSYDAVAAAATLIHFGDLGALIHATAECLRREGLFVFTYFPLAHGTADYAVAESVRLAQGGCFRHSPAYVERLAREAGFSILELEDVTHEHDPDGNPVTGVLAVLRRSR